MKKIILTILLCLIAQPGFCDITSNLTMWLKFDEGTGSIANDSSVSANNGTLVNSPSWIAGKIGPHALTFVAASTQDVTVPDASSNQFGTGDFTMALWLKTTTATNEVVLAKYDGVATDVYDMFVNIIDSNAIGFDVAGNLVHSTNIINDGIWHHIALTRSSGNCQVYIDGSASGTAQTCSGAASGSGTALTVGEFTNNFTDYLDGSVDDVRLYARALSSADVTQLYNYTGASGHKSGFNFGF